MAAALACACGRSGNKTTDNTANTATDTAAQAGSSAATGNSGAVATSGSNETIVLTGCLQHTDGNQPAADFILTHATAGAPDAAGQPTGTSGVGSNGAGVSGGPIVTGTDSYVLEGGDLVGRERQTVRVTGHFPDPLAGGVLSSRPAGASQGTNATAANSSGTEGGLMPNAKQRAQRGTGDDVAHMRHVKVDSVEMVATKCSAK
jgi:hypothetical protein